MKIYTKQGDFGETSLVGGQRVSKASARVNAYGDVDELISFLGLLRSIVPDSDQALRHIQEVLMLASAHLASDGKSAKLQPFPVEEIAALEKEIDRMTAEMPLQKAFILPAAPRSASLAHVARCVCRRAERSAVAIGDQRDDVAASMKYLNRLSDYLFTFGRYECHKNNISEDFWLV